MSDVESAETFLANYARLLPESDSAELQKILEMKGVRRGEQAPLLQLYRSRVEGSQQMPASAITSVMSLVTSDGLADSSIKRLEKLVKKKL